jgi:hypothetical protein
MTESLYEGTSVTVPQAPRSDVAQEGAAQATGSDQAHARRQNGEDPTASLWKLGSFARDARLPTTMSRSWPTAMPISSSYPLTSGLSNVSQSSVPVEPGAGQTRADARFHVLQKWEGVVLSRNHGTFWARLIDLTTSQPDQEAEIYVEEVAPRDQQKISEGAVFYWYVGYRDSLSGERERASKLRFRRLPPLTDAEMNRASAEAERFRTALGWRTD